MVSLLTQYRCSGADGVQLLVVYVEQASADVSCVLVMANDEMPRMLHWGRALSHPEDAMKLYDLQHPQRITGGLDDTTWPSVLPTQAEAWMGSPHFVAHRGGVSVFPKCVVRDVRLDPSGAIIGETGVSVQGVAPTVHVSAGDDELGIGVEWVFQLLPSGLARQRAIVTNTGTPHSVDDNDRLIIEKIELAYPLPACATEILSTTGHHLHERSPQRQPFTIGRYARETWAGRPDFDATLLLSAGVPGFGFEHGEVRSVHLGWSGNAVVAAERLNLTQGVLSGGELLYSGEQALAVGERYRTPWLYGGFSDHGLDAISAQFHGFIRLFHPQFAARPRPVLLNTWEALGYDHSWDKMVGLADRAKEVGVERFVLDDGWFRNRNGGKGGLGDWTPDPCWWPHGLQPLSDYVHGLGMEFGLWFEAEMVCPDSDTFRAHPDWVLRPAPERLPMQSGDKQVLDFTNPDVYDYIFNAVDTLVAELHVDYIKWDHNRMVSEPISPYSGRPAIHGQVEALYRLFVDLKQRHPGLEIESCSSGGARVDLAMLECADRIWASDCIDPVERDDIQRYTSLLVPPEMIGEHVGSFIAASTARPTAERLRMTMPFFGHLGVEWNLLDIDEDSMHVLAEWIAEYKRWRGMLLTAESVYGDDADPAVRVDGMVASDGSRALYRFAQLTSSQTWPVAPIRLPGLDPKRRYRVEPHPLTIDLGPRIGNHLSDLLWWRPGGVEVSGDVLSAYGVRPPQLYLAQSVMIQVTRL